MSDNKTNNAIDFSGKDFKDAQVILNNTARIDSLKKKVEEERSEKAKLMGSSLSDDNADDVISKHLDKFETPEELEKYLKGSITNPTVKERINSFFTDDETGEVLELISSDEIDTETRELEFKRGLLLYFKRNDYYTSKLDEEVEKLNKTTEELTENVSNVLNPLHDNILAYSEYLIQESVEKEDDDIPTRREKRNRYKKAIAIRSGYTFENLIQLIEKNPGIAKNALKDFRKADNVRKIGERYSNKLNMNKLDFNLFLLLSDDIKDSLEYQVLPIGEYPEGLENFTAFFIIRCMAMGLTGIEDIVFHASVYIALTRLLNNTLDEDVAKSLRNNIKKLLSYFA